MYVYVCRYICVVCMYVVMYVCVCIYVLYVLRSYVYIYICIYVFDNNLPQTSQSHNLSCLHFMQFYRITL